MSPKKLKRKSLLSSFLFSQIMLASAKGKCIRFAESDVRAMGRTSSGVRSIKMDEEDDYVVDMAVIETATCQSYNELGGGDTI